MLSLRQSLESPVRCDSLLHLQDQSTLRTSSRSRRNHKDSTGYVTDWEVVMRRERFVLAVLVAASALAFGQSDKPSAAENGGSQTAGHHRHSTITGCLSPGDHDTYRLVDQKGVTNMVYSSTVHLDSYVGQFVTLTGSKSATPSTDTGTGRPMPHFAVTGVQPATGQCK